MTALYHITSLSNEQKACMSEKERRQCKEQERSPQHKVSSLILPLNLDMLLEKEHKREKIYDNQWLFKVYFPAHAEENHPIIFLLFFSE